MTAALHEPVMLNEVLEALRLAPGQFVADGTIGQAGHGRRIWERIQPGGLLLGMDWDESMLAIARENLPKENVVLRRGNYRLMPTVIREEIQRAPDGAFLDLGLNSGQLDDPSRGIAFQTDGPLDMRMDRSVGEPASALLGRIGEDALAKLLRELGGEAWSGPIARKIVERRRTSPLTRTQDLVDCVLAAIPPAKRDKRIHPATRTFQAIRVAVNFELENLDDCIREIAMTLAPGGHFVVLSYHDGEDRPVKHVFRELEKHGFKVLTKKPLVPTPEEVERNRRARSAKMRVLHRLPLDPEPGENS